MILVEICQSELLFLASLSIQEEKGNKQRMLALEGLYCAVTLKKMCLGKEIKRKSVSCDMQKGRAEAPGRAGCGTGVSRVVVIIVFVCVVLFWCKFKTKQFWMCGKACEMDVINLMGCYPRKSGSGAC